MKSCITSASCDSPTSSVIFWDHVGRGIGGLESLIINLASTLSERVPVKLVAETNGVVYRALMETGQSFEHIQPDAEMNAHVSREDLLVCFGGQRDYARLLSRNPRVILWRIYPYLGVKSFRARVFARWTLRRLEKLGSLLFMDRLCRSETSRELRVPFSSPILPIPVPLSDRLYHPSRPAGRVSFSYVGRGTELWKVKPVKALVGALARIEGLTFSLHIFTDFTELFARELMGVAVPEKVSVQYHIGIRGSELRDMLVRVADIHYGMGTSVLEGASVGVPSIIADASMYDFPSDYGFRWLTDDFEYYAGVFLDSGTRRPGRQLRYLIDHIWDPHRAEQLSVAMHKAVSDHFALDRIASRLLDSQAQARVSDLTRWMPSRYVRAIRSRRRRKTNGH
jgi:hypothetical protein